MTHTATFMCSLVRTAILVEPTVYRQPDPS